MLEDPDSPARLRGLVDPLGGEVRDLVLSGWRIRIAGLDTSLAQRLDRRWGGFVGAGPAGREPWLTLRLLDAGDAAWIPPDDSPGEAYRIEARNTDEALRVVVSHNFALAADAPESWRLGVTLRSAEPPERIVENAVRYLVARLAVEDGGFAMHAAGVMRDGRAYLFAGPSRAGKSTAVGLARPAASLGDDFALVLPRGEGWIAPALPFDNSEKVLPSALEGEFPVAGIWRLEQASETETVALPDPLAVASLLACVACPWAMPDLAERLLDHCRQFVAQGRFERLRFTKDASLWTHLL